MGVLCPSLLPSLAEEGLVSFSERVSSEVVGGGRDTGQLLQLPGKSKNEEQFFPVVKGGGYPSLVSGSGLLSELVLSKGESSAPLLPSSNAVHFFPSVFMNVDTRGWYTAFGGVSNLRNDIPMTLRSRSDLTLPKRYVYPATPAKVKRGGKCQVEFLVRLFLTSSSTGIRYCCGRVDRRPNVQACIATSACLVSSQATKAGTFEPGHLYIRTPPKTTRQTVYLDPSVPVSSLTEASVGFLLVQEFSVKFWSSLLP